MEEIKAGEYYRTKKGKIHKWSKGRTYMGYDSIVKHSQNIIDLIEAGDYVNGMEVSEFDDDETGELYLGFPIYDDAMMDCIEEVRPLNTVEIKSIVTKEQFSSVEYRLEY